MFEFTEFQIQIFAGFAFVYSFTAFPLYAKETLRSTAKPTLSVWIAWVLIDVAILAGMIAKEKVAPQMIAYVLGLGIIIGAIVYKFKRNATMGWTGTDWTCLVLVCVAILLWGVADDPNLAIFLSIVAGTIGTIPLFLNIWRDPLREPPLPWIFVAIGGIFGVLAMPDTTIAGALSPVCFLVLQGEILLLISRKFLLRQTKVM
ncbi:MAG: hypothetical protein HYT93_00805 [Parcubacteria group bacterium]|nr:hypothetical protein [Parcubacteria group bacterium]